MLDSCATPSARSGERPLGFAAPGAGAELVDFGRRIAGWTRARLFPIALAFALLLDGCRHAAPLDPSSEPIARAEPRPDAAEYSNLASQIEAELDRRVLPFWFPRIVDPRRGGFAQTAKDDGALADDGSRFLVFQARMTWMSAQIARRYPERRSEYEKYAEHGLRFLKTAMWDEDDGGLYWELDATGRPTSSEKHVYGMAFAMFAAAACAGLVPDAGSFATRIFDWLDAHAHDGEHGGYYEALTREGKPMLAEDGGVDAIGTVHGRKSMNTHIHLLEALTELYRAVPSERVRDRLYETLWVVRDKVFDPAGFLQLYFAPDWTPIPTVESYGHDVETAFLLLDAADLLAKTGTAEGRWRRIFPDRARTHQVARLLVDRALARGWDAEHGGFFNEGAPSGAPTDRRKVWWVQAEGMNGLLAMHERYGTTTERYWQAFRAEWGFIRDHVSDASHGEWWGYLTAAGAIEDLAQGKGDKWKACYHNGRALMQSVDKLRELAARAR